MKPQTHICSRCGREMAYAEKYMVYLYKARPHGQLERREHIDLCAGCARQVMDEIRAKGGKEHE